MLQGRYSTQRGEDVREECCKMHRAVSVYIRIKMDRRKTRKGFNVVQFVLVNSGRTFVFLLEFLVAGCLPACLAVKVTAHHCVKYNWSFGILGGVLVY